MHKILIEVSKVAIKESKASMLDKFDSTKLNF